MHLCKIRHLDEGGLTMLNEFSQGGQISVVGMIGEDNIAAPQRSVRPEPEDEGRIPQDLVCRPRGTAVNTGKFADLGDTELLSDRALADYEDQKCKQALHLFGSDWQ